MAELPLTWSLGIDQISSRGNLPDGAVVDAVNINIDRAGSVDRRAGYGLVYASSGIHDLWTSEARAQSFAIVQGMLCQVRMPWAVLPLRSLVHDLPVSYCDLNGEVVCSSMYETVVVDSDLRVRTLALERPGAPGVAAASAGGLDAGTYSVAASFLRGHEEGPLSPASSVTIGVGQGLQLALAQPNESGPTGIRIYRTQANGDVLHRVLDAPVALPSYTVGVTPVGRQADNQFLSGMVPGLYTRYWHGLLLVVRHNVVYWSEPNRYGLIDLRFNFVQLENVVRVFEPVEGGVYVGTRDGMFFLSGTGPKDLSLRRLGARPPIAGSGRRIPAALLGDAGEGGEYVALWLADNGFAVGLPDGKVIEPQRRRIRFADASGRAAILVHDRRVVAVVH